MDVVDSGEVQWTGPEDHRGGGVAFRTLFVGEEGKPDNYWFNIVRIDEAYHTPPHVHNFDQVRFMLKGDFATADQVQREGTVGYFCEGTRYEQKAEGASLTLLLQTANASRSRYLSLGEIRRANMELQRIGRFEDGVYVATRDGVDVRQDGYEAVWEHINGAPIAYSEPRYDRPILIAPDRFAYTPVSGAPGVARKLLGSFSERALEISFYRLDAGAALALNGAEAGRMLLYVLSGAGMVDGDKPFGPACAMRLNAADAGRIEATEPTELYALVLPR
jgi:hypothetical protein